MSRECRFLSSNNNNKRIIILSTTAMASSSNKRTAGDAGLSDTSNHHLPDADNVPCCWVCLEEGPDNAGKPLVRDCSCRGQSGFAHLSCIIQNGESEGKRTVESGEDYTAACFAKAFEFCPNCKQQYQNDVIYELTKAAVNFTERQYKDVSCGYLHLHTLSNRLTVIDPKTKMADKAEGEENCTKILSIIEEMKSNHYLSQNWKELSYIYTEAAGYGAVGSFYMRVDTEESLKKAKQYLEKGRDIFREMGDEMPMLIAEKKIASIESKISGEEILCVNTLQKIHVYLKRTIGETDPQTIGAGADVAEALCLSYHSIEAERMLRKLVETSRRVHGMEHEITKRTMAYLQRMKERIVITHDGQPFIALRYEENDGDSYIVVKDPTIDDEKEMQISASGIIAYLGTPVCCKGLQDQLKHLNGKIGDVRSVDLEGKCQVHFEEAGLEHAEIKANNLRIVFDLPALDT